MNRSKYSFPCIVMLTVFGFFAGCASPPSEGYEERHDTLCGEIYCLKATEQCCDDVCVPINTEENCGTCGNACTNGMTCIAHGKTSDGFDDYACLGCGNASCSKTCCTLNAGTSKAQSICIATETNPDHCGACNHKCGEGQICSNNECVCTGDTELCNGVCIPLTTPENCGECGNACPDQTNPSLHLSQSNCRSNNGIFSCYTSCEDGYVNADGDISNGCETPKSSMSKCGDGVADVDEICDGNDLKGQTCKSIGYTGGMLKCDASCMKFDDSECIASETKTCGNNRLDDGELCDGTLFADSSNCYDYSKEYASGNLSCNSNCTLNLDDCELAQCEDGEKKCAGNSIKTCTGGMWPTNGGETCSGQSPICDAETKSCVGCLNDTNCDTGFTCNAMTKECEALPVSADWTVIVEAPESYTKDDATFSGGLAVTDILPNGSAFNVGHWPMDAEPNLDMYIEFKYPAENFKNKTQIKVTFMHNTNRDTGPTEFVVGLYDNGAQVGQSDPISCGKTTQTAEFTLQIGSLTDPSLRISAYKAGKTDGGTLRIYPIEISAK